MAPQFFYDQVAQRNLPVAQLTEVGFDAARTQLVQKWIEDKSRESIGVKFKLLFALTKPIATDSIIEGFVFDLKKISEIDDLRHSLVHRTKTRSVTYDDLDYFKLATNFALGLLTGIGVEMSLNALVSGLGIPYQLPEDIIHGKSD